MLHVIAVDDEITALKWFTRVASGNPKITIAGVFQYAEDAIAFVKEHAVDVAFLDIEMPEVDGLELAERLMEIDPYIKVVFVTAYNQYALDAFRAHAIGYLLKPLTPEDLTEQIDYLSYTISQRPIEPPKRILDVTCFGQFCVRAANDDASIIRWKTAKAEELFALLTYYQGRVRPKGLLIDTLWPELEPQKAMNLFRVTCTYIRSALSAIGFSNILIRELDGYKLSTALISCDLFSFRNAIHSRLSENIESAEHASAIFNSEFLEGKAYDWASEARIGLESDFKTLQLNLANHYLTGGDVNLACQALEKLLHRDPCDEEVVTRIIKARLKNGDTALAMKTFRAYESVLKKELGVQPSMYIQELFVSLK